MSATSAARLLLDLGRHAIELEFDSAALAARAQGRLYLSPHVGAPFAGEIIYRQDDTVANLIPQQSGVNAVVVDHQILGPKRSLFNLRVFNEFCVSIARDDKRVLVRYPSNAPLTYLLDDVLQAAVQPFLEDVGGFILHGACLVKNGVAFALMGSSGSGKSTTSFNLVRAGYHCYADDAIIVTREADELYAWPFSREMSIRPLSSRLLQSQGMSFSGYRQEGRKYYFDQPELPARVGAPLRFACLIEVGGERTTQAQRLGREPFLKRLLNDRRYFSFVNRDHHDRYARSVADFVPNALSIQLGHDLAAQATFFDSLLDPNASLPVAEAPVETNGRAAKLEKIRRAWRSPGAEPLADLVPMLGDNDLTIFKNALSFFQNYPLAQIMPDVATDRRATSAGEAACHWLRAAEWREGCRQLIESTCRETYDQYSAGWFKSAPLLYAFLPSLVAADSAERRALEKAWRRYRDAGRAGDVAPATLVMLTDLDTPAATEQTTETGRRSIYLSSVATDQWMAAFERLAASDASRDVVVVPVFAGARPDLESLVECLRAAKSFGLESRLASCVPLCWLNERQAASLLELGALADRSDAFVLSELRTVVNADWVDGACTAPGSCELSGLGLCHGGYFRARHAN